MKYQQEEQQLFANHSLSISCKLTERNNPFLYYQVSNQICPKQIPEIENQEMQFDDGSIQEQISQHQISNPINSTDRKSQILQLNNDEQLVRIPVEKQSHFIREVDDQKNFLQLIRRKKILQKFIAQTKQKAYIFPQFLSEQFKKLQIEQYFLKQKQFKKLEINQDKKQVSKLNFIPLFQPQQPFIILWEFVIFMQILYITWWGPFTLVFENQQHQNTIIENIIIYFGIFDIFMTMNKSIILQGQILDDRKSIFKLYIKKQLFIDIISLITICSIDNRYYGANHEVIYLILQILLLYINQQRIRAILDKIQESFDVQEDALDLIKVLLIIGFFAHISACIWARISMVTQQDGYQNWLEHYNVNNESKWIQYNFSFYWATMTMVTVGYGDITPQNPYEMLCAILIMIIASILFGYSLNSIGMIVKNINDKQQKYRKSQLLINSYMNKNQVSLQLQCKVRNYLKFYIEQDNLQNDEELNSLISKLSPTLKEELLYDIQKKPLKSMNFFIQQISQDAQKQIAYNLQPQHFTPQDIIYQKNSVDDYSLYLIVEGKVAMIDERNNLIVHTYQKGECFGQYEFFTGINRELQARSLDFTHVYVLKRDVILNILQEYAEDKQKFNNIKDQMILMKNFEIINLGCYFCNEFTHYYNDCPYLQYKPDLERLIKQEGFYCQDRTRYFRDKQKSGSAYNILTYKKEQHEKFLQDLGIEQESSSSSEKEQSQQLSNQQSNSVEKREELQTSQHRQFLQTQNLDTKPQNFMVEQILQQRKKKRENSHHTHQIQTSNLKTMQMDYEKEYTHISRRKRSQSIKDTNTKNKRRNSQDSQNGGTTNNRITLSINNTTKQFNSNPSPSIRSLIDLQQQDFVKLTEEMDQYRLQFLNCDMEKSYQYKYYFPQNNLSQVLLQYQRQQKQNKFKGRSDSNKYSIFYDVKRKLTRLSKQHRGSKIQSPTKKISNKIQKRSFIIHPNQ